MTAVCLLGLPSLAGSAPQAAAAQASCGGEPATEVGTRQSDDLKGTKGDDVIAALGGDDRVNGLGGDDTICGGGGADQLAGSAGDDTLLGGPGGDACLGASGQDALSSCEKKLDVTSSGNICQTQVDNLTGVPIVPLGDRKGDYDAWKVEPVLNQPIPTNQAMGYASQAAWGYGCYAQTFISIRDSLNIEIGQFTIWVRNPWLYKASTGWAELNGNPKCTLVSFEDHDAFAHWSCTFIG